MKKNITYLRSYAFILMSAFFLLALSCGDSAKEVIEKSPTLFTTPIVDITENTARAGGNIEYSGDTKIVARGVCWSITENPTIMDGKSNDGKGVGSFTSEINNLEPATTYFVRVYASGNTVTKYSENISFKTKSNPTDGNGNVYNIVTIGTQAWLTENLRTNKYNDGTPIPLIDDKVAWSQLTSAGFCWYDNNKTKYGNTYGALYNYYTISTGNLCPKGWHVPTDRERVILSVYLGGELAVGGKLKEAGTKHWMSPNTGADNEAGFTALPAGFRNDEGEFKEVGESGLWWSNTEKSAGIALSYLISFDNSGGYTRNDTYNNGFSIRCIRD